ncbi:MAG: macro domain-containing protein, partial [Gemmataceae bacterium]|nr:macro domain-containing protein [Gemmataceae bacterium]
PLGEDVHRELQAHLAGGRTVEPGTVVRTGPGSLPVRHILHAVAIDPSYDSSVELVARTIARALAMACGLGARTVAMPALATGFGPLSMADFAEALKRALLEDWTPLERLTVAVLHEDEAAEIRAALLG